MQNQIYQYYADEMKSGAPFDFTLNITAMELLDQQLGLHDQNVFGNMKFNPVKRLNYKIWVKALEAANI